jgi:hypothetical protein
MRLRAITLALVVIGGVIALTGAPSQAQQPATMEGDFECTSPGTFTLFWEFDNLIGAGGTAGTGTLSGAAEGTVTFSPNPFTGNDEVISGSNTIVSGDTVGIVTLSVTVTFDVKGPLGVPLTASVALDGSCEAPPVTGGVEPTPADPAPTTSVKATAATRPSFTG